MSRRFDRYDWFDVPFLVGAAALMSAYDMPLSAMLGVTFLFVCARIADDIADEHRTAKRKTR